MAWTDSPAWGAYVADCGPYVGPWPPAPPIPANLPAEADGAEVDYYISTDTLANVAARAAAGDTLDVWRFYTGDTPPTEANTGIGTTPIVGGNLFVLLYGPGFAYPFGPPTIDEFSLVPPLYVAGGSGAPVGDPDGGHWSAWTDYPPDLVVDSVPVTFNVSADLVGSAQTVAGGSAMGAAEAAAIASALAATPTIATGSVSAFEASAGQSPDPDGQATAIVTDIGQTIAAVPEGDAAFMPDDIVTVLSVGLIEGLDYAADPATGIPGELASAGSAFIAWTDLALHGQADAGVEAHANYTDLVFRLAAVTGAYPGSGVVADGGGTSLGTVTVTAPSAGVPLTLTFDASGLSGATQYHLDWQVEDFSTLGAYIAQFAAGEENVSWTVSFANLLGGNQLNADVAYPQFRYWIPSGLAWHTVAGSWASISGAPMAIFTPGLGPVDYADGPA